MPLPNLPDLLALHHLASLGSVDATAAHLQVATADIDRRLTRLSEAFGGPVVAPAGGGVRMTERGEVVVGYGRRMLGLAREAQRATLGEPDVGPPLQAGVADVLPKVLAWRLLSQARETDGARVRLLCSEGPSGLLNRQLARGELDLVLTDIGDPAGLGVDVVLLGSSGLSLFASRGLADHLATLGSRWLDAAPILLPARGSRLRADLDRWLAAHALRPKVAGEFDDSALLKAFAAEGAGVFAMHDAIAGELTKRRGFVRLAGLAGLEQRVYAHVRADQRGRSAVQRILSRAPAAFDVRHEAGVLPLED